MVVLRAVAISFSSDTSTAHLKCPIFREGFLFLHKALGCPQPCFFFFVCLRRDAVNPLQALRGCSIEQKRKKKICLWTVRCYWGWFLKRRKGGGGGGRVPLHVYPSNYRSSTKKKKSKWQNGVGGLFFRTVSLNGGCLTEKHCKILHTESQWVGERGKNEVWK